MEIDLATLPSDATILRQIIGDLIGKLDVTQDELSLTKGELNTTKAKLNFATEELDSATLKLNNAETELAWLQAQLALLKAKRFGRSSEKLDTQIAQLEFFIDELESSASQMNGLNGSDPEGRENEASSSGQTESTDSSRETATNQKQKPKRQKLPEHLPRTDIILEAPSTCTGCGGDKFRKISDDIAEVLEYVPSSFKVMRYIRPRCACVNCENIMQAYPRSDGISKGKAGPGLLAHILVQKYCNHLPLHRQSQIYEREGIEISRSTMTGWMGGCARLLEPLIEELRKEVFSSSQLHGDDTPVKVLAPGLGKTRTARIWAYVRDGRPYGDDTPPAVCYFYSPDRRGERPQEHLKDYSGILHADAYGGFDKLYKKDETGKSNITEAMCWAHVRRKFYEITVASDNANIAHHALEEIAKLYQVEEVARGLAPENRQEYRQLHSKKIVEDLFASFAKWINKLPAKSLTARAIAYALNNKTALMNFLDNGKIEIDNNAAERSMRSIAVGRKNWLFAGSDAGGQTAAAIYSLIETAKLNGINPWLYLKQVLSQIQDYNSQKLADLLPWNIKLE